MKAYKYELDIPKRNDEQGIIHIYHMLEYYIPSEGIYFNETGKIFLGNERRYLTGVRCVEKEIDDSLVAIIKGFIELKERLEIEIANLF